jgi:hypothetical protein
VAVWRYIVSMAVIDDPLVAPPPTEVPLTNTPLVRVIAQVRFPLVVAVGDDGGEARRFNRAERGCLSRKADPGAVTLG